MRAHCLAVASLLIPASLVAQLPTSNPDSTRSSTAPRWAAFYDLAALTAGDERYGFEHRVARHWFVGLTGTYAYRSGTLGTACCELQAGTTWRDNSWSIGLAVRYERPMLSAVLRHRLAVRAGASMVWRWSDLRYFYQDTNENPGGLFQYREYRRHTALEPGAEAGARLRLIGPLFVDVGGWFRLVRLHDPTEAVAPGRVESHVAAAVGIGW